MTYYSQAGVRVTPDVYCRNCSQDMEKIEFRRYKCSECGRIVDINGEYELEVVN